MTKLSEQKIDLTIFRWYANDELSKAGLRDEYVCKKLFSSESAIRQTNAICSTLDDRDEPEIIFDLGWDRSKVHEFIASQHNKESVC